MIFEARGSQLNNETMPTGIQIIKELFGEAKTPQQWFGRCLMALMFLSVPAALFPISVAGVRVFRGTTFVLIGIMMILQGAGMNLWDEEFVEKHLKPDPGVEVSFITRSGDRQGIAYGLFWIAMGVAFGLFLDSESPQS